MLTPKQELFCLEYIKTRNGTRAYIRAGYSAAGARQNASLLLTNHYIRVRINELLKEQLDRLKISADFVVRELLNSATVNIADAYEPDGRLKALQDMPEQLQRAITKLKTEELFEGRGKDRKHIGTAKTIEINDSLRALELLGKHLKMFTDVHEIPGLEGLAERIKAGRMRLEAARARENHATGEGS